VVAPNEPFRMWVVNAGPTLTNAFHVIGTLFNETHDTGNPANTMYGLQTFNIPPGSGAMFELQIPDPGLYPLVTHSFAYTALGAVGLVKVDPNAPPAPASYPTMGDPFTAGVEPASGAVGTGGTPTASGTASPSMSGMPGMSSTPSPTATATASGTCDRSGSSLTLVASGSQFDTDCLQAPADKPITIALDNKDPSIPHNVSIYTDSSATKSLFVGETITGPGETTYKVGPLPAGTYFFRCDIHPTTMTGTLTVP
jgi:plastocyanin